MTNRAKDITAYHIEDCTGLGIDVAALMEELNGECGANAEHDWDAGSSTWELCDGSQVKIEDNEVRIRADDTSPWVLRG